MLRWVRCLERGGDLGGDGDEKEEAEGDCDDEEGDEEEDEEKGLDGGERTDEDEVRETFPTGVKLLEINLALIW